MCLKILLTASLLGSLGMPRIGLGSFWLFYVGVTTLPRKMADEDSCLDQKGRDIGLFNTLVPKDL